jgi:deoxycytidylate deaminase
MAGDFSAPDIENCIQKSGYHIFYTNDFDKYSGYFEGETQMGVNLDIQLVKFISLLFQSGIITPTAFERNMQIAFNAKANSGCISRQVGAVITDANHAVKSIGWNDVAANQIPCKLRDLTNIANDKNPEHFSDFEKGLNGNYKDGETFKTKVTFELKSIDIDQLNGKNCAFCFKTFHNVFEGMSNQVHTRSLHAEENAMLQLTKYGGQGVENGILYTTASPCELCSKKAFQLGIREVIYIDPYPGIATNHILKSGKTKNSNPKLKMFRGAVGTTFHKLYEPIISYKDELNILAKIHPEMTQERVIKKLTSDINKQEQIKKILNK